MMSNESFLFRWYGETKAVSRNFNETQEMIGKLIQQGPSTEAAIERLKEIEPNGYVLDFGCSFGVYSNAIAKIGNTVCAVDISEDAIKIARTFGQHPKVDYQLCDLMDQTLEENSFDGIFFSNTIEHLYSVEPFLKEFFRVLKPGGYIVCATPNAACLLEFISSIKVSKDPKSHGIITNVCCTEVKNPDLDHVSAYTRSTLVRLFDRMGFSIDHCKLTGYEPFKVPHTPITIPKWLRKSFLFRGTGDEIILRARKPL